MSLNQPVHQQISDLVTSHRAVLFMKGTRQLPKCGFSAKVVRILDGLLPDYEAVDVLGSQELRDAVKDFSQWPTFPQFYLNGAFIGGCDIVREMNESGELAALVVASSGAASQAPANNTEAIGGPLGHLGSRHATPTVVQLTPHQLKLRLDRGEVALFDVRPESERQIAKIAGSRALSGGCQKLLYDHPPDAPIAVYCHHGFRSQVAAEQLLLDGFRNVYNLIGGIDAWSQAVDPSVPRYE
jgi:Grx4 family monothiol glutaredoxin